MAKSRVQGIVVEIGGKTTGLDKALKDVNKEIYSTADQLRDVERLLKMDPGNTELLQQRQRLLNQEVEQTAQKLDTLRKAEKQVQQQFKEGKVSQEQYEALQREIIATDNKLGGLKTAAKDADNALEKIDDGGLDEVTRSAKQAEKALDNAGDEAADFGDVLSAGALVEGASQLVGAISGLAEETKEYRKIMGTLEVSSEAAGYSAEETKEAYTQLYGVLGDEQSTATALANLQAIGLSQEDLLKLIKGSTGAWAKYGDSIPIDGLAEAINETVKSGKVTGNFADVLNWGSKEGERFGQELKVMTEENQEYNDALLAAESAEDYFNLALSQASTEAERADLIMQALAGQGLTDVAAAWEENNQTMLESNEANARLQEQLAQLGELIEPIMTKIVTIATAVLEWFNGLDDGTQKFILGSVAAVAALGPMMIGIKTVTKVVGGVIDILGKVKTAFSTIFAFIAANPIVLLIAAVTAMVAAIAIKGDEIQALLQKADNWLQNVFARDWTEVFGPVLGEALNAFFANIKNIWDSIRDIMDGVIDFIRGVFSGDWKRAWNGVKEIMRGVFNGMVSVVKSPINGIIGLLNGLIYGANRMIARINSITWTNPFTGTTYWFDIGYLDSIPYLAKGGTVLSGSAIVGEAGPELLTVANGRTIVQPLGRGETPRQVGSNGAGSRSFEFIQNNYSPEPLDTYTIYRNTQLQAQTIAREVNRR